MSDSINVYIPPPEGKKAARAFLGAIRSGGAVAAGLGLTGLQSLMRPDDLPPGRGRNAYRLAFGGLSAVAGLLTNVRPPQDQDQGQDDTLDPSTARKIELGTAAAAGVLSAVLFHPRITANWWGDRLLARLGVTHTRTAGALIAVSVTAGLIVFSERMESYADQRTTLQDGR